jgi:hypothetical protein
VIKDVIRRISALRHLSSFMATADGLLTLDLPRLGGILLLHLKSYERPNTVFQNGRLHRDYFIAMLENRNVGLEPLPHRSWSSRHIASSSGKAGAEPHAEWGIIS